MLSEDKNKHPLSRVSKRGQLNWIHRIFSKDLFCRMNTRGYKNAPPQPIFIALAEATDLTNSAGALSLLAVWEHGTEEYGNGQMSLPRFCGFLVEHSGYLNVGNPRNRRL